MVDGFLAEQAQDITTGLVSHWKFDETSGTTATDSSGNGNNGTVVGGATFTTGKVGNAVNFYGVNDFVDVADSASLDISSNITLSAWAKFDTAESGDRIVGKNHSACAQPFTSYVLSWGGGTANRFTLELGIGGTNRLLDTTTVVSAGNWYHLVGTYDGATMKIYLNGILDNSQSQTGAIGTNDVSVKIGKTGLPGPCSGGFWDGLIDDVRVYNRLLTADEIRRLYNMGR